MRKPPLCFAMCIPPLLAVPCGVAVAQQTSRPAVVAAIAPKWTSLPKQIVRPGGPSGSLLVDPFEVNNIDRMDAILMLARRYRVPLGIEFVDEAMFQPVTVRVPSGDTIKSALDFLAPPNSGFLVTAHENVFVISHQNVPSADNVLDTVLDEVNVLRGTFEIADLTLKIALDRQLRKTGVPQPQGTGGSLHGVGSKPLAPFEATKISVREVLDRIVGEDGNAAWIVQVRPPGLRNANVGLIGAPAGRLDDLWQIVDYDAGPLDGISQMTQHAIGEDRGSGGH